MIKDCLLLNKMKIMKAFFLTQLLIVALLFSCRYRNTSKDKKILINKTDDTVSKSGPALRTGLPLSNTDLKISAYLIYDDGTLSTFDILNDKTLALWNTIIGEGDALKPSKNTKFKLTGNLDSLNIKIKNGSKLVIDTNILHSDKDVEYVVKKTGCAEVYVSVTRNKKVVCNDTIPFHCGE